MASPLEMCSKIYWIWSVIYQNGSENDLWQVTIILSSAVGIEVGYSSDKEELCDKDYEGALMGEDTTAVYSDWINEMRRINKQKTAVMLLC